MRLLPRYNDTLARAGVAIWRAASHIPLAMCCRCVRHETSCLLQRGQLLASLEVVQCRPAAQLHHHTSPHCKTLPRWFPQAARLPLRPPRRKISCEDSRTTRETRRRGEARCPPTLRVGSGRRCAVDPRSRCPETDEKAICDVKTHATPTLATRHALAPMRAPRSLQPSPLAALFGPGLCCICVLRAGRVPCVRPRPQHLSSTHLGQADSIGNVKKLRFPSTSSSAPPPHRRELSPHVGVAGLRRHGRATSP